MIVRLPGVVRRWEMAFLATHKFKIMEKLELAVKPNVSAWIMNLALSDTLPFNVVIKGMVKDLVHIFVEYEEEDELLIDWINKQVEERSNCGNNEIESY